MRGIIPLLCNAGGKTVWRFHSCVVLLPTDYYYPPLIQLPTKVLPLSRCATVNFPANVGTDVCVASVSQEEGYRICRPWGGNALIGRRDTRLRSQLVGLLSNFFCERSIQKGKYLRIASYVPWILDTMKSRASSDSL